MIAPPADSEEMTCAGTARERTGSFLIRPARDRCELEAYRRLRAEVFVHEQGLFNGTDHDDVDDDPRSHALVAVTAEGKVLGGVRIAPRRDPDIGWWFGSRLVVAKPARRLGRIGPALVKAACFLAESLGALRFDATVQLPNEILFRRLGWTRVGTENVQGTPHVVMAWPIDRAQRLVDETKRGLGPLLKDHLQTPAGYLGDDGSPLPGSNAVVATDAILPSMVERDPEWAGWCAILTNLNDLAAMGAPGVALTSAVAAPNAVTLPPIIEGITSGTRVWDVPLVGGHTQFGAPAALSITAFGTVPEGHTAVRGGGARPGHALSMTADLHGQWRPGYEGSQWDSTSTRSPEALRAMHNQVARARPAAAKDVSMAGLIGTLGMMAEASGCAAVLDIGDISRPTVSGVETAMGDWLTAFPGYVMLTADVAGESRMSRSLGLADPEIRTTTIGTFTEGHGVRLRWPDGRETTAITHTVTGLGRAS